MQLFILMLPVYLLGNIHCLGMCGPIAFMLGKNRHRLFYFLGRIASFTLAGLIAGEIGAVLQLTLAQWKLAPWLSIFLGGGFILLALKEFLNLPVYVPKIAWVQKAFVRLSSQDQPSAQFLIGFFTLFLPCGQSLMVFSACALSQDALVGLGNGFAFALLTTPALWCAQKAHFFLKFARNCYREILALLAIIVGVLAILRGCADLEIIEHLVLIEKFHLILF